MKRRGFALVFIFLFSLYPRSSLFSQDLEVQKINAIIREEEVKEAFPLWAKDLRRAEIILFGSLPFTLFFSHIAFDSLRWYGHDWDMRYAPWPLKGSDFVELSSAEAGKTLALAFGISALISIGDHIVHRIKRQEIHSREARRPRFILEVENLPPPQEEEDPLDANP